MVNRPFPDGSEASAGREGPEASAGREGPEASNAFAHHAELEARAPSAAEVAAQALRSSTVRVDAARRLLRPAAEAHVPRERLDALAGWAAQLLGATSARIALLSDVHTRVGGGGGPPEAAPPPPEAGVGAGLRRRVRGAATVRCPAPP